MVKIVTDTTSCLHPEVAKRYDIPVIPQIVSFGEESYYEGEEIDFATFLQRLRTARELPKTAAPPPELFRKVFDQFVPLGEPILCIHPSAEVSGTVRSAQVAAQDYPNADIRVIDTRTIATPLGTMVELAAEWARQGADADTIVSRVQDLMRRCRLYFLVATLEYLARGGRIGGASYLVGSVLQIKPILTFQDGRVEVYEKERTQKRALARLQEIVLSQAPTDGKGYLTVMHSGVEEEARQVAETLGKALGQAEVPISPVPPAIITHGGPGVLGVAFFTAA